MIWNEHSRDMPDGSHAILSPSSHSWINYSDEKMTEFYINKIATSKGTELHELACHLITLGVRLPSENETLNMYVNDCIDNQMEPEKKLYYSEFCYGTADAISVKDRKLKIYDLKTGKNKASFVQLEIYAALFFLEYPDFKPGRMKDVELRIYQNNEVRFENPEIDLIVHHMDKITHFSRVLKRLEEKFES